MSKRIPELPLATQLNAEDQFIFYSNADKEAKRVNAGTSLNVIASNLPGVLKATTNASLAVANAAAADAKAAQAAADAATAQASANGAQDSANGKNKIFYQTTAPTNPISGYTLRENDLWFDTDGGYRMAKWNGSSWVDYGLETQAIANVDAGKITSGFISSQVVELANVDAYLQSSSFIETWTSGRAFRQKSLGKATPSDQLQCKVEQLDGTFLVYDCLSSHTSSGASFPGVGGLWALTSPQPSSQSIGFRIVGNGQAEFNGVSVRGDVLALTGYFGNNKSVTKIGANGLTIGNQGYIKSDGITYAGTAFSGNGFFLGNTQGEGQEDAYQFYIGNAATSKYLRWDGTNLVLNGRVANGSILGGGSSTSTVNSGGGIIIGDTIGIRRSVDNNVLTITGGTDNWATSGAGQLDLVGKNTTGGIAGIVQLIAGSVSTGHIYLRTGAAEGVPTLTAHYNGSVGINDNAPSNSNGIKLDVNGSLHIRSGVVYSTYTGYSGYTVALNDGVNDIRFQNNNVGLYAKVGSAADVLIASPKLNLSSQQILAPFSFGTAVGSAAGGIVAGTLQWDGNGTITQGSGVAMTPLGLVGGQYGSPKFTIGVNGDATFSGTLSAPVGNFGGWTIGNTNISGGNITIDSSTNNGYIATGQTAYNTGTGFWVGSVSGTAKLSLGNSAGNYLTWDGSTLTVNGSINVTGGNASTQTYAQGVASSAANAAQSAAASDATAKANAAQAVAIGAAASDATTKANAAQATSIQAASLDATLKANTAYTNAKAIADAVAQGTYSGGTLISGGSIFSPVVAGVNGYFSQTFKVGNNGITLDGVNKSIYIGTGTYANANTGFYVDSNAYFSLKDKLYWNPSTSTLTVQGNIVSSSIDSNSTVGGRNAGTIAGAINSSGIITSAALSSKLDTAAGTILGQFALQGSGALQIGTYTNGSSGDIRITPNGITARNSSGATTFSLDGTTGAAVFKGDITGASGTFAGALSASSGTIGGFNIDSTRLYTSNVSLDTSNKILSISEGGTAILEVINSRARFATKNNGGTYTAIFQGDDGIFSASFLSLNDSSGSEKIGFYAASGYGYFTTFYDKDDTGYYCNPASTSNFNGLNVGGSSVLTSGSTISVNEVNSTGDVKTPTLRNNANDTYTPTLTSSSNGSHTLAFRFADDKLYILIDGTTEKYVNLI